MTASAAVTDLSKPRAAGGRAERWPVSVVAAAVLTATAVVAVPFLAGPLGGDGGGATKAQVMAYEAELTPLVVAWGKIEMLGMRPTIADMLGEAGDEEPLPGETIVTMSRAWEADLKRIREDIANIPPPPGLEEASQRFDDAIVRYVDAARFFGRAADAPTAQRRGLVDAGIDAALDGTRLYNEASMVLQAARRSVGLAPSPDFPDHPAAGT